jgi:sulfoxide reductase heme-binding subunit YedZ
MRRPIVLGIVLGGLGLVAIDTFAARTGLSEGLIPRLAGDAPWIVSRALGITAFVALTSEVVFGLLSSTAVAERFMGRARAIDVHSFLSTVTLSLIAAHALVLLFDAYAGFDVFDLLVPFVAGQRRVGIAFGILAAYVALALHTSSRFRKQIGAKAWRRLHFASFAVFIAATVHGIVAGSDSGAMRLLYAGALCVVGGLTILRVGRSLYGGHRARGARA